MSLPIDEGGSDPGTGDGGAERAAEEERLRLQRERLRAEVRRLEQAEHFAAALQAIKDSGLAPTDPAGLQPEIARLKQAIRLQASYQRARAAVEAGDGEAAALLAAVVAVDPRYKDAARLLHETVSGVSVGALRAEIEASQEAASLLEAERDRLARGRTRLAWVAGALGVVVVLLLGWLAWHRPPSPAAGGRRALSARSGEARGARPARSGAPEGLSPVPAPSLTTGETPKPPAQPVTMAASTPEAAARGSASSTPDSPAPAAASEEPPPPELDGPCRRIGESCSSSVQCCFGSLCYGTTCQDTRRTIVFGQYRP